MIGSTPFSNPDYNTYLNRCHKVTKYKSRVGNVECLSGKGVSLKGLTTLKIMGSSTFKKLMQFMSQTSHSPKLVSFFAVFIPYEIQALPEILFCHVGIVFCCYIGIIGQNQGIRETSF